MNRVWNYLEGPLRILYAIGIVVVVMLSIFDVLDATEMTAYGTLALAIAAFSQIIHSQHVLNQEKTPTVYIKNVHLFEDGTKPHIDTRGIANLSRHSIAVHAFHLFNDDNECLASCYPLWLIRAGDVLKNEEEGNKRLVLDKPALQITDSARMANAIHPSHLKVPVNVRHECKRIVMVYRFAGTPNDLWEHVLEFKRDEPRKKNSQTFDCRIFDDPNFGKSNKLSSNLQSLMQVKRTTGEGLL